VAFIGISASSDAGRVVQQGTFHELVGQPGLRKSRGNPDGKKSFRIVQKSGLKKTILAVDYSYARRAGIMNDEQSINLDSADEIENPTENLEADEIDGVDLDQISGGIAPHYPPGM
jgi:hypothetical protein